MSREESSIFDADGIGVGMNPPLRVEEIGNWFLDGKIPVENDTDIDEDGTKVGEE
jgi:hypothetical protein